MSTAPEQPDVPKRHGKFTRLAGLVLKTKKRSVYRGFNMEDGVEVLWHVLNIESLSTEARAELDVKFERITQLNHRNIVTVVTYWKEDGDDKRIHFITELMSSGSLNEFMNRPGKLSKKTMVRWCTQILAGLQYLHSLDPAIVHRKIVCQNLYFNGNTGEVKIACWDLALTHRHLQGDVDAPGTDTLEYMAPEMFDDDEANFATELTDIYSLGMCILQLSTKVKPYMECKSTKDLVDRTQQGAMPASLTQVEDGDVRDMITLCLAPKADRPTAAQLLRRPFLKQAIDKISPGSDGAKTRIYIQRRESRGLEGTQSAAIAVEKDGYQVMVTHKVTNALLSLQIKGNDGKERMVHFPYNSATDTPDSIANDMKRDLQISQALAGTVTQALQSFHDTYTVNPRANVNRTNQQQRQSRPLG